MITWKDISNLRIFNSIRFKKGAVIKAERADGTVSTMDVSELAALNDISSTDLAKIDGITNGTGAAGKALVLDSAGNVTIPTAGGVIRSGVQMTVPVSGAKVGATAGWTVNAATDLPQANVAASVTAATLILPIKGLVVGDVITGIAPVGHIQATGNIATMTTELRKNTAANGSITDASVGSGVTGNISANTALNGALFGNTSLSANVAADTNFYAKITVTTAAATLAGLQGVVVTVTKRY